MRLLCSLAAVLIVAGLMTVPVRSQGEDGLPFALAQMLEAERAFAARALVVGWKQAFLETFADSAMGFENGQLDLATTQIQRAPDPPADHRLIWEPRYGDVAASGELGYLTGPVQSILPSRDNGRPRHSVYTSIWKRGRLGAFEVILDVGVDTPNAPAFPDGFTRAAVANRFTGDYDETTPPLATADSALNAALRTGQAAAYRGRLASGVRFHRPGLQPVVGERNATRWLASQPVYSSADARYAESSRSGDLGYTWGSYTVGPRAKPRQQGFYVRVWVRERNGQWLVAMDILQPAA